jgi:hypothetical protein
MLKKRECWWHKVGVSVVIKVEIFLECRLLENGKLLFNPSGPLLVSFFLLLQIVSLV